MFAAVGYSEEDWQDAYIAGNATYAPPTYRRASLRHAGLKLVAPA